MRRIEVEVPKEIEKYFSNKKISKIIKGHRSGDLVYRIGNEYILKISRDIESLNKTLALIKLTEEIANKLSSNE